MAEHLSAWNPSVSLRAIAEDYHDHGLSVVPAFPRSKVPCVWWKAYQYERPSVVEREAMFSFESNLNIGVVCGAASNNLAIIDAETEAAFQDQLRRVTLAGFGNTNVIRTRRGGHIQLQLPVPVKPKSFKHQGFEIRAQGQFVVLPPSIHPSGTTYTFINQPSTIIRVPSLDALDWLNLEAAPEKEIPRRARYLLQGEMRGRYDSRSEVEQAIISSLCVVGFSFEEVLAIFRSYPAAGKFREQEAKNPALAAQYLRTCFNNAREFCATDSPARQRARTTQVIAEAAPWPGRTGSSDRSVFLAHTTLAHRSGQPTYHASSRDVAEIAGVERKTATRASRRLAKRGFIELVQPATFAYANRYRLPEKTKLTPLTHMVLPRVGSTSSFSLPDAFRQRGFGRPAFEVLTALGKGPLAAKEIAWATGRHVQTVRKSLLRLRQFNCAEKLCGKWSGKPVSEINLDDLARSVGTSGARQQQKEKYRAERLRRRILTAVWEGGEQ
jgi:hypothetical protein